MKMILDLETLASVSFEREREFEKMNVDGFWEFE